MVLPSTGNPTLRTDLDENSHSINPSNEKLMKHKINSTMSEFRGGQSRNDRTDMMRKKTFFSWIFVNVSSLTANGYAFQGTRILTPTFIAASTTATTIKTEISTTMTRRRTRIRKSFQSRHYIPLRLATCLFQSQNDGSIPSSSSTSSFASTTIPVIGPILNTPPLLIGASIWLDPPTPLQWKTIEVCVDASAMSMMEQRRSAGPQHHPYPIATIDAAPLVAVIQSGSDLASIAAIVGYSNINSTAAGRVDTFDSESLRESFASLSRATRSNPYYSESSRVRLLCIGRAKLSDFRTVDITLQDTISDNTSSTTAYSAKPNHDRRLETIPLCEGELDDIEEEAIDRPTVTKEPILIARMQLLLDTTTTRDGTRRNKGEKEDYGRAYSSPIHALSQLSMWSARICFVHNDRRRLVQRIQAAQSRLNILSWEWKDQDGIGSLFTTSSDLEKKQTALGEKADSGWEPLGPNAYTIHNPTPNHDPQYQGGVFTSGSTYGALSSPKVLSPSASRLLELDNYGLGSTASAYSDIDRLTGVIVELLQVYYSPERTTRTEEFEYSMFSWVALQSVMEFSQQQESTKVAWQATNTLDRMEATYHMMISHVEALRELALAKNEELHDCGEECELFL